MVAESARVDVRDEMRYVGRGAYKLIAALDAFPVRVEGSVCADVGAATGGFTQVLLERGAAKIYAIDTARGKLALKLRDNPRVAVMEATDVRDVDVSVPILSAAVAEPWDSVPPPMLRTRHGTVSQGLPAFNSGQFRQRNAPSLPEQADIAVADVSLMSLRDMLPAIRRLIKDAGAVVALFKPQYETRDPSLLRHGVVKDDASREMLLQDFKTWLAQNGWQVAGEIVSPIRGSKGNTEYLFYIIPV